jgi:V8-like Glu-specific endopeptidase
MAYSKHGTAMLEHTGPGSATVDDTEDLPSGSAASVSPAAQQQGAAAGAGESQYAVGEVAGDAPFTVPGPETDESQANAHEEVGSSQAAESGEDFLQATPEQLSRAESGEESAVSDLRGIEGFEEPVADPESAASGETVLLDAGAAMGDQEGGQEEFLPVLAALAPTLVSAAGPPVARAIMKRLPARTKRIIKSRAAGVAAKGIGAAVKRAGGTSKMLGLVSKLLESAEQAPAKGAESGMELDQLFIEEAAAVLEVIIGTDDRVRVTQTTQVPWRRYCALRIHFPSGATYRGTGFLIGPRAVATAGHCVYLHNQGGWARKIEVIPGCNGTSRPFGAAESSSFRSVAGWVTGKKPESDYGCIILPPGAFGGRNLGSFGFAAFDAATLLAQSAVLTGYPGDKPFAEMWGMARRIKTVTAKTLVYDIDTVGGQSGAPVYIKRNGQRYVVGIHNYGAATGNSATRVTQPVYQRLLGWSKI